MSNAVNERPARPSPPWSAFDPPADLPDDLKDIYRRAAGPIRIAASFCSHPDRFDYPPEQLSAWLGPLKRATDELAGWLVANEANLRAEAPEVLTACEGIHGDVRLLVWRLGSLIGRLDPRPADPNDAQLVALVNAVRENSTRNHLELAHASLDGISISRDSLTELRSALSVWDKGRREQPAATSESEVKIGMNGSTEKGNGPPVRLPKNPIRPKATVNARMLEAIQTNPEAMGWNSRQWAEELKCSKPAVVETQTWANMKMVRERNRAERKRDRRRRPNNINRRCD
jgi:hypothetical protein